MNNSRPIQIAKRANILQLLLYVIFIVFAVRLFYIQVLKGGYYSRIALANQQKQYEITPERGSIYVLDGNKTVPIVLNERRYRLVADPSIIRKTAETAQALKDFGDVQTIEEQLSDKQSRYEILAKKLTKEQAQQIRDLDLAGVFIEETPQRNYPQGVIGASLLGFIDDEGAGKYGIEQALDEQLHGKNGRVKAITDHNGVPLLAAGDNVEIAPEDGKDIVLSINLSLQRQVEELLKSGLEAARSDSGGVVVMKTNGEIAAMASYPTYDPAKYYEESDPAKFVNTNVGTPYEVGSIMKPLTVAAALDSGAVNENTTFYDPGYVRVDDRTVTNVEEVGGAGTRTIESILLLSLNTGATKLLQYMGGGEINSQARNTWYDYMFKRYRLGNTTNVEQGYEEEGIIPDPDEGWGLNIQYANTSFGQGMTATPLQMAAALNSVINGKYYQPTLVHGYKNGEKVEIKEPKVIEQEVVSQHAGNLVVEYMQHVVDRNLRSANRDGYVVGGKTGTAQIPDPSGGYYADRFNGSYMGFVGLSQPEYVVVVRVNEPKIAGYAGSKAAAPIFSSVANMIMDTTNLGGSGQ